jgi:hypothetical protein
VALALGTVLALAPALLPPGTRRALATTVDGVGPEGLAWLFAAVAGLYALYRGARGPSRPSVAPEFVDRPPERAPRDDRVVGADVDRVLARRVAAGRAGDVRDAGRELRRSLRGLAVEAMVHEGLDREAARGAVRRGDWTDDRAAAAFLGGAGAPSLPLRDRVRGWLDPDREFERRLDRTVAAIDRRGRR